MKNYNKEIFEKYIETLLKWQKSINLISPSTIPNVWERHFEDSLFLYDYIKDEQNIFDIGSGGGFPALVLSIAGIKNITIVESDKRKCLFLNEIKRIYNLDVRIINDRVENLTFDKNNCIIGRAFAPLDKFLNLCANIINKDTKMFLLKGSNINNEIIDTKKDWNFNYILNKKPNGFIISISNIYKKYLLIKMFHVKQFHFILCKINNLIF